MSTLLETYTFKQTKLTQELDYFKITPLETYQFSVQVVELLYLGEDQTTNNADIALRGTVLSGGGGNVRAAVFSISTATSNGSGVGGTIQFQTSTSGNATASFSNALRTRLRIEGAATGTSSLESIIILGDAVSGTGLYTFTLKLFVVTDEPAEPD